ncbi:ribosome recycling factor [Candidatus Magnetoovum chiemensis]|nr:ribosome recycling factor [Candidatus Magnetoovum chiemensis]
MDKEIKNKTEKKMEHAIDFLKKEFASIRTGRASLSLLDGIIVEYYGSMLHINQVATLSAPDPQTIAIQPWEQKAIPIIEKAILKSDIGLNPANDGKIIRINIPTLTEERRKQLAKVVKKRAEEAKVAVRNVRRDINEEIKKIEKEQKLSEDETKKSQTELQKLTDAFIKKIDEILSHKEKEIMEV